MFCVGCEMLGTERKEELWRETIAAVRQVYHGELVYNPNHGKEDGVRWWDAVDYIGTSAYFRVAAEPGASLESMKARLPERARLRDDAVGFLPQGIPVQRGGAGKLL